MSGYGCCWVKASRVWCSGVNSGTQDVYHLPVPDDPHEVEDQVPVVALGVRDHDEYRS